jgi:hypothetical protein
MFSLLIESLHSAHNKNPIATFSSAAKRPLTRPSGIFRVGVIDPADAAVWRPPYGGKTASAAPPARAVI